MQMKRLLLLAVFFAAVCLDATAQVITISAARAMPLNSTVTVKGIVTNGSELGVIRYIEDGTAGIGVYSSTMTSVSRGDSVTVTGTLMDFNNLLEISPVSSFTVNSTGNTLPNPQVLTPSQLGENNEGELVQINNVVFANAGNSFAGNTTYNFTASSQSGSIFVRNGSPLVGQLIPSGQVTLIGILSQYQANYQVLPRDMNDIITGSSISITAQLSTSNITTTGFNVSWTTNINGSTFVKYGKTQALELGIVNGTGNTTNHTVSITGTPATIYYVKAYSVAGTDTAVSATRAFATASNSTGDIKVYFNESVDNSYSTGTNAIRLDNLIDDTLIAYIDRSKYTLDIAIYSFDNNNISNIATALNNAYNRGVDVRIIYEGGNTNAGLTPLNAAIPRLASPTTSAYGIMHNKFMIMDANSSNPNDPIVWTGGTNWTDNQINTDANSVIIFQDQTLARTYEVEFEEMWGDTGMVPNQTASRFGPYKADNTPHEFIIGGKRVEQYFSPSDNVNSVILDKINSANSELCVETMLITRSDLAYAITNRSAAGVMTYVLVDDQSSTSVWSTLQSGLPSGQLVEHSPTGMMHHKTMLADPNNLASDPLVLTGSHNWSNSADQRNDENTVVVHDPVIANIFYQEFIPRYTSSGGVLSVKNGAAFNVIYNVYPNPSTGRFFMSYTLDKASELTVRVLDITGKVILEKQVQGDAGTNVVELGSDGLSAGVYFLQVQAGNATGNKKLIVH
jgi:phosphatidylserine/phosphatidylglycerophosphate/cardiolipin synthase-like enzyme